MRRTTEPTSRWLCRSSLCPPLATSRNRPSREEVAGSAVSGSHAFGCGGAAVTGVAGQPGSNKVTKHR